MEKLIDWLNKGKAENFAVGAFNLDSFETLKAVCLAARKMHSPVIVEVSPGEEKYLGLRNVASLVDNARREFDIPIFLNLDHADDMAVIEKAVNFGFDLIHFDGSKLPLEDNVAKAIQVVTLAHGKNILVEGEINHIPNAGEGGEYTDPVHARDFVTRTGVDIFAVSIGNNHGVSSQEKIDIAHLQKIRAVLPEQLFSLHGGSGLPAEQVQEAIKLGVVKVNINSEMRLAFKTNLKLDTDELAWYKITEPSLVAVSKVAEEKIAIFGSSQKV